MDEEKLNFKPITDGLGFRPFSDGMPYAPVSKAPQKKSRPPYNAPKMGAGAETAGQPQFLPPRLTQRVRTAPTSPTLSAPSVSTPWQQPSQPKTRQVQQQAKLTTLPQHFDDFSYAYVAKRFLAFLVDSALNISLCSGALYVMMWRMGIRPAETFSQEILWIAVGFIFVFNWALITAQEVAFSTTIGKRLFGLTIIGGPISIFLRAFFFPISLAFGGLGILTALIHQNKRCWHDSLLDIQPIEVNRL